MAFINLLTVNGRNLTGLLLFKMVLLWSLSCFGPSQTVNYGRQGLFKQIKGECFTTTCISKYRVASASQCSQRCVQVKTCVGIRYRRTTKPENFCQINCEILKKIERCCSQSENEINDRAWKIYIIPLPTETPEICSKSSFATTAPVTLHPDDPDDDPDDDTDDDTDNDTDDGTDDDTH